MDIEGGVGDVHSASNRYMYTAGGVVLVLYTRLLTVIWIGFMEILLFGSICLNSIHTVQFRVGTSHICM